MKLVRSLKSLIPSSFSGRFLDWVKMVAFKFPVTEDSIYLKNALEFWMVRSSVRLRGAASTSVLVTEW